MRPFLKWLGRGVLALLLVGAAFGGYVGWIQYRGNFAPIVPGVAYRSAQPTAEQIASYVKNDGIRSIINLRGASAGQAWYDQEVGEAGKLGVAHYDFRMSASQELSEDQAKQLIALMEKAEKPVLVHCAWGADRSGLASALYLAAIAGQGEAKAESQLSLRFGHISLPISKPYAMDRTFEALEPMLGFPNS